MQQVISISPDGGLSGLLHKPGKGVDLRQFGKCDIARVSLVEWDEDNQLWYIKFLKGPYAGQDCTDKLLSECGLNTKTLRGFVRVPSAGKSLFHDYDDAVAVEIAIFNELRRSGKLT